ncbi:hypothetical protein L1987_39021 [Smallanthus sonchifolius]|uniref:Uncharacterized protein n=1 Tax=Smallanthus sonchifolius TaxID=185202 RepID=A0ACB9HM12_9ASTR|nr:hypothetical protein L1987_39021 [Smallanthus sonchifolius]
MWSTKSTYGLKRNWQGDPCVPRDFIWDGVNCNFNDTDNLRIISMDLSYNNLTGSVPKFLASLDFLRILDQDTDACPKGSCNNNMHRKAVVAATTSASLFVLLTILTVLWVTKRRRTRDPTIGDEFIEPRNQRFTYSEVERITDGFSNVIGKGGFGTVFHGLIEDTQVAVKMLSESSAQGCREFQAEVSLLMSIHHKNITSLVGYCDEGSHKGIIYEYMANGNLGMHLFDGNQNVLSWKKRLEIGKNAAQGRRAISTDIHIIYWVKSMVEKGSIENIIDPRLQGDFEVNTARKMVELAVTCVDSSSVKRPTMNDVVTDLRNCLEAEKGAKPNNLNQNMSLSLESMSDPDLR